MRKSYPSQVVRLLNRTPSVDVTEVKIELRWEITAATMYAVEDIVDHVKTHVQEEMF